MNDTEEHGSDHRKAPRVLTDADVQTAKAMATAAHLGQVDKAGCAYIEHPERVVGHLVAAEVDAMTHRDGEIAGLRAAVCTKTIERLGGALDGTGLPDTMDRYLPAPALGDLSGVLGAIALAEGVASRADDGAEG